MNAAKLMHEKQRQADKKHHEDRLAWMAEGEPKWGCGTPVSKYDQREMIRASTECLRLINEHGMSLNHASLD